MGAIAFPAKAIAPMGRSYGSIQGTGMPKSAPVFQAKNKKAAAPCRRPPLRVAVSPPQRRAVTR